MKRNRWVDFFEGLVVVAILLVLVQTFFEDYAVVAGWKWSVRRTLIFTGFAFDLFFTIEFLTRLYFALLHRRAAHYFLYERGWIDFLASIPLLLLNSGPTVLALVTGASLTAGLGGFMNVLKVVKAIRIARILRLLRILKLLRRVKNVDSVMAQRHVGKVSTIGVSVFVFVIFGFSILSAFVDIPTLQDQFQQAPPRITKFISDQNLADPGSSAMLRAYADTERSILMVKSGGQTRYSRFGDEYYANYFGPSDYGYLKSGGVEVFFDLRALNAQQSLNNLIYFSAIVILVFMLLFYYGPHFALTVSDPVHVMRRGLSEGAYNLEVRVPDRYQEDDVFRLARLYNEQYLPLKDRTSGSGEAGVQGLKMDDFKDLFS
ncbi:ion transporter [Salinispira pacifica]